MSIQTVNAWLKTGAPGSRGAYDLEAIAKWRAEHKRPPHRWRSEEEHGDQARLLKAQADERQAKAALAEMRAKVEAGEYRSVREIEEWDRARVAVVKRGLLAMGRKLGPTLVGLGPKELEVAIGRYAKDLLRRFAKW